MDKKLTLSVEDSHAKTSALQDPAKDLLGNDLDFGRNSTDSSKKSNRSTRSSKTLAPFDLEDWIKCSGKSLRSATMQNGIVYPHHPLAPLTVGIEFGFWPTIKEIKRMWPTPSTRDHKGGYIGGRIRNGKVSWDTLDVAVQHTDNQSKTNGQLNPTWVEWLMGFPTGWTDLNN